MIAVVVGLAVFSLATVAAASAGGFGGSSKQLDRVAEILGISSDELSSAMSQARSEARTERMEERLATAVADANLTQDEADAIRDWFGGKPEALSNLSHQEGFGLRSAVHNDGLSEFRWPAAMVLGKDGNLWLTDEGTHRVSVLTVQGELVSQWGEFGNEPGRLNRPSGIAHGPDGNVYIADTLNHRVQKFTTDGRFLSTFGEHGREEGQFDMPWGIDVDELGDIFVSDWRNDRVQKFTPEGEFVFSFGSTGNADGEFNRPSGLTVDKDGDICVADWANNRVQLFDQTGRFVEKFIGDATLGKQARGYMITNLVAMRLREMTSLEPQKRLRWPTSVRTDSDGRLYIADYGSHRIQVYRKEALALSVDEIAAVPRSHTLYTQF